MWGRARITNHLGRKIGRCTEELSKKGGGHVEEEKLKGNVRVPFIDVKRVRHRN